MFHTRCYTNHIKLELLFGSLIMFYIVCACVCACVRACVRVCTCICVLLFFHIKFQIPLSMIFSTIGILSCASSSLAALIHTCRSVGMFSRALFNTFLALLYVSSLASANQSCNQTEQGLIYS